MENQAKAKRRGHPKEPMSAEWHRTNEEIGARLRMLRRSGLCAARGRGGGGGWLCTFLANWGYPLAVGSTGRAATMCPARSRYVWLCSPNAARNGCSRGRGRCSAQLVPQPTAETPVGPSIFCVS